MRSPREARRRGRTTAAREEGGGASRRATLLRAALFLAPLLLVGACSAEGPGGAEQGADPAGSGDGSPAAVSDASTAGDGAPDDTTGRALPSRPAEACVAFFERGLLIEPGDRARLREQLGPPDSVGVEAVPNRHVEGVTDSVFTLRWAGAEAVVHRVGEGADSGGRELVDAIRVRSDAHLRWDGIGPGARVESVILRLGDPPIRSDDSFAYLCSPGEGAITPLVFHHADGRVTAVEWDFYVD